jgi:hypothetical protein
MLELGMGGKRDILCVELLMKNHMGMEDRFLVQEVQ